MILFENTRISKGKTGKRNWLLKTDKWKTGNRHQTSKKIPKFQRYSRNLPIFKRRKFLSVVSKMVKLLDLLKILGVTSGSCERSFSKLKLVKNVLRTTMLQQRLNSLLRISIEKETMQGVDDLELIQKFITAKERRLEFI